MGLAEAISQAATLAQGCGWLPGIGVSKAGSTQPVMAFPEQGQRAPGMCEIHLQLLKMAHPPFF